MCFCCRVLFRKCVEFITQRHHTVVHVHVFDDGIGILQGNIIVAEIPERADPDLIQLIGNLFHCVTGNAKNSHGRGLFLIKLPNFPVVGNLAAADHGTDHLRGIIKSADQLKAKLLKGHMTHDRPAKISGPDQNTLEFILKPQNFPDLYTELRYVISVALLPEAAEAVNPDGSVKR